MILVARHSVALALGRLGTRSLDTRSQHQLLHTYIMHIIPQLMVKWKQNAQISLYKRKYNCHIDYQVIFRFLLFLFEYMMVICFHLIHTESATKVMNNNKNILSTILVQFI